MALYRRPDGIVDFDGDRCIGCKSCMQACPYDALYIDPAKNTAAKCNFCANRVELGLRPACEIVCPTEAIISGDLDDPTNKVSRIVASQKVTVRKAEKGTKPKLFYVGVDGDLLRPTMMEPQTTYSWAEKHPAEDLYALAKEEGNPAPGVAREVYDVPHPRPWAWKIATYLWTKSIASGVLLVSALFLYMGYRRDPLIFNVLSPVLALAFLGVTVLFLISDLKRPERFYYLLTKPNLTSWLVWGGYILIAYGFLAFLWLVFGLFRGSIPKPLYGLTAILALAAAGYSAFLFAQAKGRDLWQSPLFLWHLIIQAIIAGSASLIIFGTFLKGSPVLIQSLARLLGVSLILSLAMIVGELLLTPVSEDVRRATDLLKRGDLSGAFWGLAVGFGAAIPLIVLSLPFYGMVSSAAFVASVLAISGLWAYELLWIEAGQAVPLS